MLALFSGCVGITSYQEALYRLKRPDPFFSPGSIPSSSLGRHRLSMECWMVCRDKAVAWIQRCPPNFDPQCRDGALNPKCFESGENSPPPCRLQDFEEWSRALLVSSRRWTDVQPGQQTQGGPAAPSQKDHVTHLVDVHSLQEPFPH